MPKCYRVVNGEQRKGTWGHRKNGKGYCKLIRKKDAGVRVGIRYGKVVYASTARGALFYYSSKGKKTYLRPKQVKESVLFDPPKQKQSTSSYLRNNEAPVKHGQLTEKRVSAKATVVDRIEDDMPDPSQNFQVTMAPKTKTLKAPARKTEKKKMAVVNSPFFKTVYELNADGSRKLTDYENLEITVKGQIEKYTKIIEKKHTVQELKDMIKKSKMGTVSNKNKEELARIVATYYRQKKPWKLTEKYDD